MDNILVEEKKIADNITMAIIREINQRSEQKKQETKARNYSKECKRKKILNNLFVVFFVILFTASMALPGILCTIIEVIL